MGMSEIKDGDDSEPRAKFDIANVRPIRNPIDWVEDDKTVVITFKKSYTRFERWLNKYLKGPEHIRLRLDEIGASIWMLCDGEHSLRDICAIMHERYQEAIEPVVPRVSKFMDMLGARGLIRLESSEKKKEE